MIVTANRQLRASRRALIFGAVVVLACTAGCAVALPATQAPKGPLPTIPSSPQSPTSQATSAVAEALQNTLSTEASFSVQLQDHVWVPGSPTEATGSVNLQTAQGTIRLGSGPNEMSVAFKPDVFYVLVPATLKWNLPAGRPWVTVDLTRSDIVPLSLPQFAFQLDEINPDLLLTIASRGLVDAAPDGPGDQPGSTRYVANISLAQALGASQDEPVVAANLESDMNALPDGPTLNADISVDGSNHVVQIVIERPGTFVGVVSELFSHFGQSVHTSYPHTNQTVSVESISNDHDIDDAPAK
jgi:hypothetical protein